MDGGKPKVVRKTKAKAPMLTLADAIPVCKGAGMTAGLEICKVGDKFVLVDHSTDSRFSDDVTTWNESVFAGLNPVSTKKTKDATK